MFRKLFYKGVSNAMVCFYAWLELHVDLQWLKKYVHRIFVPTAVVVGVNECALRHVCLVCTIDACEFVSSLLQNSMTSIST